MMFKPFGILLIVYFISICSSEEFLKDSKSKVYPYVYKEETKHFYKVHNVKKPWVEAKATCETEGGILFYPEDRKEAEMVKKIFEDTTDTVLDEPDKNLIHIGLTDQEEEGEFLTVDGRPISEVYHNWAPGEPNDGSHKQNCVQMLNNLEIDDSECDRVKGSKFNHLFVSPFVCKKKPEPETEEKKLKDYTYKDLTKSFYKMHKEYKSWVDAKEICEEEGTLLFYPESLRETLMIRDWWARTTLEDMTPSLRTWIHVGLTDMNEEGEFETVDGIPISEVYDKWQPGEPNNNYKNKACVDLLYNLNLMDSSCNATESDARGPWDSHIPFVCKKKLSKVEKETSEPKAKVYPYVYKTETKHMYKVHNVRKPWVEAKATCEEEGSILFYPENKKEAVMVKKMFEDTTNTVLEESDTNLIHIGLTDIEKEGKFVTVDGRPISEVYHNWAPGEPNDGSHKQNCVQMVNNLDIDDSECDRVPGSEYNHLFVSPFVCKRKPCPKGYVFSPETESCYAFKGLPLSWEDANVTCSSEGSHLAVINSNEEASMLVNLNNEYSPDLVDEDYLRGAVHLGFHNKNENGWETVTGNTLDEEGYSTWGKNQPDGGDNEKCGSMFPSGRLNDISCDSKCFYICESKPF